MSFASTTTTTTTVTTTATSTSSKVANPQYVPQPYQVTGYRSFADFYPFYLGEHNHATNRRLHLLGTTTTLTLLASILVTGRSFFYAPLAFVPGYFCAWVGHFLFEKNKPATFKHPFYSLMGDLRLFYEVVTSQRDM
ncbi:hypothetical protein BDF19DRAFT_454741 [Syncephalis fuscata]|nr:hypothetical protein BDF19DRAFT_454741 [Syncephalis fuscata]